MWPPRLRKTGKVGLGNMAGGRTKSALDAVRLALVADVASPPAENGERLEPVIGSDENVAVELPPLPPTPQVERKPVLLIQGRPICDKGAALACLKAHEVQVAAKLVQSGVFGLVRALVNLKSAEQALGRGELVDLTKHVVVRPEDVADLLVKAVWVGG